MKLVTKIGKIFYWDIFAVLIIAAVIVAISVINIPGNYKLLVVKSGSMAPAIHTGSIVLTMPQQDYKVGDVITFKMAGKKETLTHRVNEVIPANTEDIGGKISSETRYVTKGDANNAPESEPVSKSNVIGKVLFSVPLIGYLVAFEKTLPGLILLILIPATVIVYSEVLNISREVKSIVERRKEEKLIKACYPDNLKLQ